MNLHDISLRIENPALLIESDIPILQELVKKYPYSQLLPILYLKALAKNQSLNLEEEVGKHAYKITDRVRLYELLNEPEEVEVVQEIIVPTHERRETRDDEEVTSDERRVKIDKEDKLDKVDEVDESVINGFVAKSIEGDVEIETMNIESIEGKKLEVDSSGILDLDVISHAISGVFEQEFEPSVVHSVERQEKEKQDLEVVRIKGTKQQFSTWLKVGGQMKNENVENKADKLIDAFIQEDPKISQPKKEFYSPIKQGKESLDSDNIQYTETLANILGVQGNYPKAILAYEQLCLTIPEKKTFFVQKIKELKEKLNS